jgi:long-chain acyl-CoA synthetase
MLLHHSFQASARMNREKVALVTEDASYTYGEIEEMSGRLAVALQNRGVKRGDRVGAFLQNGLEFVVVLFASLKAGAVFLPIGAQTKRRKLAYILADAAPAALLLDSNLQSAWDEPVRQARGLRAVIVTTGGSKGGLGDGPLVPFDEVVESAVGNEVDPSTTEQDLAALIYTSGSTGEPKGVMLTHLNMISAAGSVSAYLGLQESDVIMCSLPLSFDYGLYQVLMGFEKSARVVVHRSFAFPVRILEAMEREHVTVFPGVPTMFTALASLQSLPRFDLSRLRMITNTAAALSKRQVEDLRRLFPQARIFSMYGLTECKRVTYLPPEQLDVRPTSVGRGMPNQEVYLVDEEGTRLPPGSVGELVVRGSHVMRGYWRRPDETAQCLRPGPGVGERVLFTGDLFRSDEEGYLYFLGRKDDIIKTRGEKVAPCEVENVLQSLNGVLQTAVVGVPDALLGEAVKAFLVLKPGHAYTEREVVRYCLANMEGFMAPRSVEFLASLPKTSNGKIDRLALKGLERPLPEERGR